MSALKRIVPIEQTPGMPEAIANVVAQAAGKVCSVCGLERFGHGPESEALGYDHHGWDGMPATSEQIKRAGELTSEAYRIMRSR